MATLGRALAAASRTHRAPAAGLRHRAAVSRLVMTQVLFPLQEHVALHPKDVRRPAFALQLRTEHARGLLHLVHLHPVLLSDRG